MPARLRVAVATGFADLQGLISSNRKQRDEEEAKQREEMKRRYEEEQAREDAKQKAILDKIEKIKAAERKLQQAKHEEILQEAAQRSEELRFSFSFA